jgi:uncharacterized coiled-coil protein SlyX
VRQREGLIARIVQMRRVAPAPAPAPARGPEASGREPATLESLEVRVAHVEGLVQGLQDSVHRESSRQEKRIAELEARLEPGALAIALSEDARHRGL